MVSHSLSAIAVQAGLARVVLGSQPEPAAPALAAIETASRSALEELCTLLIADDEALGSRWSVRPPTASPRCARPGHCGRRQLISGFDRRPGPAARPGTAALDGLTGRDRAQLVVAAYEAGLVAPSGRPASRPASR